MKPQPDELRSLLVYLSLALIEETDWDLKKLLKRRLSDQAYKLAIAMLDGTFKSSTQQGGAIIELAAKIKISVEQLQNPSLEHIYPKLEEFCNNPQSKPNGAAGRGIYFNLQLLLQKKTWKGLKDYDFWIVFLTTGKLKTTGKIKKQMPENIWPDVCKLGKLKMKDIRKACKKLKALEYSVQQGKETPLATIPNRELVVVKDGSQPQILPVNGFSISQPQRTIQLPENFQELLTSLIGMGRDPYVLENILQLLNSGRCSDKNVSQKISMELEKVRKSMNERVCAILKPHSLELLRESDPSLKTFQSRELLLHSKRYSMDGMVCPILKKASLNQYCSSSLQKKSAPTSSGCLSILFDNLFQEWLCRCYPSLNIFQSGDMKQDLLLHSERYSIKTEFGCLAEGANFLNELLADDFKDRPEVLLDLLKRLAYPRYWNPAYIWFLAVVLAKEDSEIQLGIDGFAILKVHSRFDYTPVLIPSLNLEMSQAYFTVFGAWYDWVSEHAKELETSPTPITPCEWKNRTYRDIEQLSFDYPTKNRFHRIISNINDLELEPRLILLNKVTQWWNTLYSARAWVNPL